MSKTEKVYSVLKESAANNLTPKKVLDLFAKYPLMSQEGKEMEAKVLVKYFNPAGAGTWLITEASPIEDKDWELFGYMELGDEWEWGYIMLSDLQNLKLPYGLKVERDLYTSNDIVKDFV